MDISNHMVVAGPCAAESREQVLETAQAVAAAGIKIFRAGLWKPRTKPGEFDGVGTAGLEWLSEARSLYGLKIATEVASTEHLEAVLKAGVDYIWLGARTVTNPFAVQTLADALKGVKVSVMVKNPINPDVKLWLGAIERIENAGIESVTAIHRGFSSYEQHTYRNNPLWSIPIELKRKRPSIPLLCDPSHISGRKELVAPLCQQALELNYDGFFIEVHCHPECALTDARQQVLPSELVSILSNLDVKSNKNLSQNVTFYRDKIDEIDRRILELLSERMEISQEIGKVKKQSNAPLFQGDRYNKMLEDRIEIGKKLGLSGKFVEQIVRKVHEESLKKQLELNE
ncbi:MAG: bifunctional 3-deoxy-7-phosphoheptulonate synthase/chorismate mutase type II [Bacteroidales bacterium]|nr:bifunctional 3-deoxy-7-phosphoheptulonate synthase/chorismate mutase type II [Bacteroidales bacterium]